MAKWCHELQWYGEIATCWRGSDRAVGLWKLAKQRRANTKAPAVDKACVTDWIGGFCPADSLMIWFPALGSTGDPRSREKRARLSSNLRNGLMHEQIPAEYRKQYQEARDSRALHFRKRQYLKSPIHLLTASIRVDWFSLPMQSFLDRMPNLRLGLIKGIFQTKASSPWAGNKSERIQVSQRERSWYMVRGGVSTASCMARYYRHPSPLLQEDLCVSTPGHSYPDGSVPHVGRDLAPMEDAPPPSMESMLILNRPCRPAEEVKDSVIPRSNRQAWWNWESTKQEFENMVTKAGVIWFVDENEAVNRILEIVGRDEIAMAITYEEAKEHDTLKEGRATKRRRKDGLSSATKKQAWCLWRKGKQFGEYSGTICQRRSTECWVDHWELFVSLFHLWGPIWVLLGCRVVFGWGGFVFWFLLFVVLLPGSPLLLHWDAQDYPLSTTATIVIMSAAQEHSSSCGDGWLVLLELGFKDHSPSVAA